MMSFGGFSPAPEAWPPCDLMFPMGDPSRTVVRPIFAVDFRGMLPSKTFIRTESDPLSVALKAPGAELAPSRDFRMMSAEGLLELPFHYTGFRVWELGDRIMQKDGGT